MKAYLLRVLVSLDVLAMSLLNGKQGETLSAAAWSLEQSGHFFGFWRPVIDWLFSPFESDHCANQWLTENRHGNT